MGVWEGNRQEGKIVVWSVGCCDIGYLLMFISVVISHTAGLLVCWTVGDSLSVCFPLAGHALAESLLKPAQAWLPSINELQACELNQWLDH